MTYNKKERENYNIRRAFVCETLGITKNQYNWFRRQGEQLHQYYEQNCNGAFYGDDYETATGNIYGKTDLKAQNLSLFIYYQTDPRGATIYLDKEPIINDFYTASYCIY